MNKNKEDIALKTLKLLETNSFNSTNISKLLKKNKIKDIGNKNELLSNLSKYIDFQLNKNLQFIEASSSKDLLFEIIMARFDVINAHRKSIKNLIKYFFSHPVEILFFLPSFIDSIILIATLSNINITGLKGITKIKGISALYILILFSWYNDETDSLDKTMYDLDKYLNQIEKLVKIS